MTSTPTAAPVPSRHDAGSLLGQTLGLVDHVGLFALGARDCGPQVGVADRFVARHERTPWFDPGSPTGA